MSENLVRISLLAVILIYFSIPKFEVNHLSGILLRDQRTRIEFDMMCVI